jgi:hypothetical protein
MLGRRQRKRPAVDSEKDLQTPDRVDECPEFGDEAFGN